MGNHEMTRALLVLELLDTDIISKKSKPTLLNPYISRFT